MGETKVVQATSLKIGSYVILEGAPCKVVNIQISKPGKHGHAKVRIVGVGLIDEKKRDVVVPGHENLEVPIVGKKSAQILSIQGDTATVMDSETFETFDMKIPEELKEQVAPGVNVLYWEIMDQKIMKQIKPS
ncbi:MAG: translation initiation factor IF-5A [Candidatus Woesearchaeota archaeon]